MADHLWTVATFGQLGPLVFKRASSIVVPFRMTPLHTMRLAIVVSGFPFVSGCLT